jgi:hypothetical protein
VVRVVRQEEAEAIQIDRLICHGLADEALGTLEAHQGIPARGGP